MTSRLPRRYCYAHGIKLTKRVGGIAFCERCRYDEAMQEKSGERVTDGLSALPATEPA